MTSPLRSFERLEVSAARRQEMEMQRDPFHKMAKAFVDAFGVEAYTRTDFPPVHSEQPKTLQGKHK